MTSTLKWYARRDTIQPTIEQALKCLSLCQSLSNMYRDISLFRFDGISGTVFILAGENIQLIVFQNGLWEFINET